jgi:hypothetical protein
MPFGAFVNALPPAFFIAVHLAAFAIGAYLAYRSFEGNAPLLGWGLTLYAIAELVYMTYHLDLTVFLFAHTIAEVLDLVAFVAVFAGAAQHVPAPGRRVA